MKRILLVIPSTTYRTGAFMHAAAKLGVDLVVASDHRQAMAALVPDSTIALNFQRPETVAEKVLAVHRQKPFAAIVGVDDGSVYIAGLIARALSIEQNPLEAIEAARNKFLMRKRLSAANGLLSPRFELLAVGNRSRPVRHGITYPAVVKPLFLSGSRGVVRVNSTPEFMRAISAVLDILALPEVIKKSYGSEKDAVLIEEYIPGVEVAVEGILSNGELKNLAIFDKPDPLEGPYFVETLYVTPSRLPAYVQREIIDVTRRSALAIGLRNGPLHGEFRINEQGVWPVEIAARSIGGLCSRALRFQNGRSLEEIILMQALGEDITNIQRERPASGVMMMPVPATGTLRSVENLSAALAIPGIEDIIISIPEGEAVEPLPAGGRYLGFIFARADTPEDAEEAIRLAYRRLKINVD